MRTLICVLLIWSMGCQPTNGPEPSKKQDTIPNQVTAKQRVDALKKLYKLTLMKSYSTDDLKVYRAQSKDRDTLVGVGSNGELFEGVELIATTTHPAYIARYALGIFVSPQQRPKWQGSDGYLSMVEDPKKIGDVYRFYTNLKGNWMLYTWDPNTQKLTSTSLMPMLHARYQKETTPQTPICARKAAYCGCWPKNPCMQLNTLDKNVYAGDATHRRLNDKPGEPTAYVYCATYPCPTGQCLECHPYPTPCTASCKTSPRPSYCKFDKHRYCREYKTLH